MGSRVSIQLLGPVWVEVGGAPLRVDTRKATALLAYLAVTGRPASRESLAALLWPEADGPEARAALRRTLSVLNAGLGSDALAIDRASVALREGDAEIDLRRFRAALGRARDHGHEPDVSCRSCMRALEEAIALDRGEFMSGFALRDSEAFDEWQVAEAESHRRDLAGALERLARALAAAGATERALAVGRRWLELDSLHEPAHRLLMVLRARSGEPAAAIRQYRDCVRILDRELGVAPLPETAELYEAIRAGRLISEPLRSARLTAATEPSLPAEGPALPLVGRDPELETLTATYRSVGPDGRLVVIEGEGGIGKTRLTTDFVETLRDSGGAVLAARAFEGEAAIPLAAVSELIRRGIDRPDAEARLRLVRPDLLAEAARLVPLPHVTAASDSGTGRPGDPFTRARLVEAITEVLTALASGPTPGAIWIDDLNRADDSSLGVIAYIARRLRGRPLLLLATWRGEEADEEMRDRVASVAERDGLGVRIGLGRLGRGDVGLLATASLGSAGEAISDRLYAESEGLPLYVAEALASPVPVGGPTPGGVVSLLRSRIAATGELARQVLGAAAVIGRTFELETVRSASGRSEDEAIAGLEDLVRRGLVREEPNPGADVRYDFSHGRLRDVAYDSIGLARRRLLHRRVATALAGSRVAGDDAARWALIAYHETLAGRSPEAAEAHRQAGEHARAVFANREAREHLEAAVALGHPRLAEIHQSLGEVLTLLGDYAGAIAHLDVAAALIEPTSQATIEHRLGLVHARRGDWARADRYVAAALASAGDDDARLRSTLLADRSAIAHRAGDPAAARRLAQAALQLGQSVGDLTGVARAEDLLGILARAAGDLSAAGEHLERSLAASMAGPDPGPRIAALNSLALVRADAGDRIGAIELTREALALCERQGDRHRQAALENNLADLLRAVGRPDEAMEHLKRAVAIFAEVGGRPDELEPEIWKLVEW